MERPLISIIVPVYNVEQYLSDCLDSLINQSYKNIEIICVNDGSTDSSLDILEQYQQRHPNIKIVSTKNSGLAAARNLGMTLATGEFITFVDSDDWIETDTLETMLREGFLTKENLDIICFGLCRVIDGVKSTYRSYRTTQVKPVEDSYVLTLSGEACGKLYRHQFLKANNIHFPVGLYYEDITFHWTCIAHAKEIATLKATFYNYRMRADSIMGASDRKKPRMAIHHLFNLKNVFDCWERSGFLSKHRNLFSFVFEMYVLQGYKFLYEADKVEFVEELNRLVESIKFKPPKCSLTYDLVNNKPLLPIKYRWAKSLRKKLLKLRLV